MKWPCISVFRYLLAAFLLAMLPHPGVPGQPNVVIILADDMGYDAVSANKPAIGAIKTPHIDRLTSQGMNFPMPSRSPQCARRRA